MADPRFYKNRGPLQVSDICERLRIPLPPDVSGDRRIADLASPEDAAADHLIFLVGKTGAAQLSKSRAGVCFVEESMAGGPPPETVLLKVSSPSQAFSVVAAMLYPEQDSADWDSADRISPTATLEDRVRVAPGAVISPHAQIGEGTSIGPSAVIGPGVLIGRHCVIGSNVTITHSYVGDDVMVLPGAQIGQPGFGFNSGRAGHAKIPQLGRVILQDKVEIGACTTIDRGALGDTVIGEGTKIDNLVQIGHNCHIGRHCVIVSQVGMSGSCELGDFVVLGGQIGMADHVKIGDGARLAARSAVPSGELAGGQDYGGFPALPVREWRRQMAAFAMLGRRKRNAN